MSSVASPIHSYRRRSGDAPPSASETLDAMRRSYRPDVPRSDYDAAQAGSNRFIRTRKGLGGSADAHYFSAVKLDQVREYARDMDRNDGVVGPLIDRAVINQLQTGYRLEPNTGDAGLDTELRDRFVEWAGNPRLCDHAWERTYWQQCWYAKRQVYVDGDILRLLTEDGSIQTIEADRLQTPTNTTRNVVHGVRLDGRRKVGFWVTKDPGMSRVRNVSDVIQYDAYDSEGNLQALHLYNPQTVKRITQTRGVTALAPIFLRLAMYEDIQFAKLVQQQVVSAIAYFLQRDKDYVGGNTTMGVVSEDTDDSNTTDLEKVAAGVVMRGKKGEQLKGISPNIPNAEYFMQVRLILTEIGINLGVPLVLALMDASETNFSGWRGAVDAARQGFRVNQKWFEERELKPVNRWLVRRWLATPAAQGGLGQSARDNKNVFKHSWGRPAWPYIHPLEDAKASQLKMETLQESPQQVHSEKGTEWTDVVNETVTNWTFAIRAAKKAAADINVEFPDDPPVHWRECLAFQVSDAAKVLMSEPRPADPAPDQAEKNAKSGGTTDSTPSKSSDSAGGG